MSAVNRRIVLDHRPAGTPEAGNFRRDDQPAPEPGEGQILLRNHYLSIDPAQRGWISPGVNFAEPVAVGDVMRSLAVGAVAATRSAKYSVGEYLYGWFGWQDYCVAGEPQVIARVQPAQGPVSLGLGLYGISGVTAYLGLTEIGRPRAGETVLVSTAAGAVGSVVGQLARRLGCRVAGLTGSDDKVRQCLAEYGYHAALNYRSGLDAAAMNALCPQGIDVFFDNASGEIADAVWPHMNLRGRVVQCGTAAVACWDPAPLAPRRERIMLTRRLRHEGFMIFDHLERFPAVIAQLARWHQEGTLVFHEDIETGLDRAPAALAAIFRGENRGKKMVRITHGTRAL
ncbi:MAG: NADP-dependent oxidoreductase [Gammaproteobacteria bacterium]|nr:NADP-dependent oxidoreductase [Gammaproteobacteria bacterium]